MVLLIVNKRSIDNFNAAHDNINDIHVDILNSEIEKLKGAALQFSRIAIHDAKAREKYVNGIAKMSAKILREVNARNITVQEGAALAQELRNIILEESRAVTTNAGRAIAKSMKGKGRELQYLLDKYASAVFKKTFTQLTQEEKSVIYYEVIKSSGRSKDVVTTVMPKLAKAARVCIFITVGLALYEIAQAENPQKEAIRQTVEIGGGVAGAAVGTYAGILASGFCGPGAPLCAAGVILIGLLGGGLIGQEAASRAMDSLDESLKNF